MVLRDILSTIQHSQSNPETAAACLEMLSIVASAVCFSDEYSVAARAFVTLWLGLWRESVDKLRSSDAAAALCLSNSLVDLVSRTMIQPQTLTDEPKDLVSGNDRANTHWVSEIVNKMLLKMLDESDESALSILVVVANFFSSDAQSFASTVLLAQFASSFVRLLSRSASLQEDKYAMYAIFSALGRSTQPLSIMTLLARESIPALARLAYRQSEQSTGDLDNILAALIMFATSRRYSTNVQNQEDMAMAAVLMLFLSMLPESDSEIIGVGVQHTQIAEAILTLATAAPASFKSILLKLSASQPEAKKRLESAIRSRATATATSSAATEAATALPKPAQVVDIEAANTISLKSSFNF
ncbi:hypothetical protein GGI05_006431 [Coemansia sp. RSA 2603]|nr:hypothetical protein GGI05_006431 [Coemansia sp. RSA 2603]